MRQLFSCQRGESEEFNSSGDLDPWVFSARKWGGGHWLGNLSVQFLLNLVFFFETMVL